MGVECGHGHDTMNRPGVRQPLPICKHFERLRALPPSGQRRKDKLGRQVQADADKLPSLPSHNRD